MSFVLSSVGNGGNVNANGAMRVRGVKRPKASMQGAVIPQSMAAFSPRDEVLVDLGDEARGDSEVTFDVGSSSKAANETFDQMIGRRLALARRVVDMTADTAADKLRISKQALYKYERGERTVKAKTLYDAAKLYGVDGSWLLCLTDDLKVTRRDGRGRVVTVSYRGVN